MSNLEERSSMKDRVNLFNDKATEKSSGKKLSRVEEQINPDDHRETLKNIPDRIIIPRKVTEKTLEVPEENVPEGGVEPNKESIDREEEPKLPESGAPEKPKPHIKQSESDKENTETKVSTPVKKTDTPVNKIDINNAEKDANLSQKVKEHDLKSQNDAVKTGKRQGACSKCIII